MVVEMMELLHGLSERESVLWSEWECEREREQEGALVKESSG